MEIKKIVLPEKKLPAKESSSAHLVPAKKNIPSRYIVPLMASTLLTSNTSNSFLNYRKLISFQ